MLSKWAIACNQLYHLRPRILRPRIADATPPVNIHGFRICLACLIWLNATIWLGRSSGWYWRLYASFWAFCINAVDSDGCRAVCGDGKWDWMALVCRFWCCMCLAGADHLAQLLVITFQVILTCSMCHSLCHASDHISYQFHGTSCSQCLPLCHDRPLSLLALYSNLAHWSWCWHHSPHFYDIYHHIQCLRQCFGSPDCPQHLSTPPARPLGLLGIYLNVMHLCCCSCHSWHLQVISGHSRHHLVQLFRLPACLDPLEPS